MVIIQPFLPRLTRWQEPVGFSTFFLPAFISHDCRPNCMWHYESWAFFLLVVIWMWSVDWNLCKDTTCTKSWVWEESLGKTTGIYGIY